MCNNGKVLKTEVLTVGTTLNVFMFIFTLGATWWRDQEAHCFTYSSHLFLSNILGRGRFKRMCRRIVYFQGRLRLLLYCTEVEIFLQNLG